MWIWFCGWTDSFQLLLLNFFLLFYKNCGNLEILSMQNFLHLRLYISFTLIFLSNFKLSKPETMLKYISVTVIFPRYFEPCSPLQLFHYFAIVYSPETGVNGSVLLGKVKLPGGVSIKDDIPFIGTISIDDKEDSLWKYVSLVFSASDELFCIILSDGDGTVLGLYCCDVGISSPESLSEEINVDV